MCGIAGFWDFKHSNTQQQLTAVVDSMRDTLIHRGPDGAGSWVDAHAGIALGHRRLSILDLSIYGQQPMLSHSRRFVVSYNGEIYNHQEIKQQLIASGNAPNWRGHSDTEIMLAAFEAWGISKAVEKFTGMFAIALWDAQEQLLYLIRDRMGEKPLYYGMVANNLLFGSELKSLKAHPAWRQNIDRDAVGLLMRYNCIPAPCTIYQDIRKLEPGHILVITKDQQLTDQVYWSLSSVITKQANAKAYSTPEQAVDALEQKLSHAIKQQMVADVPLGAFLSGGIDSSTIVALMQTQSSTPVKTFTIGFESVEYNEAVHAKAVAAHLGTQHTELYLSAEQAQSVIPDLSSFYDEPFSDSSQVPTYIVAKLTREHVTVSLSGDGGDELFGGYNRYNWVASVWQKISILPKPLRILAAHLLKILPSQQWDKIFALTRQRNAGDKLYKLASVLDSASPQEIYNKLISQWYGPSAVVPHAQNANLLLANLANDLPGRSFTESMMYMDSKRYLPDDILVKVDRAAMAVGLETRVPFLDHHLVEFVWSLPLNLKIRSGQNKWILRQVLKRHVPEHLFERPKMGFGVPIDQWLRGPLKTWANDLLSSSMLAKHDLIDSKIIQQKWQEHLSGKGNWQHHLWSILMFQSWYEAQNG